MTADRQNISPALKITRRLVWVFCLSFAFDFRGTVSDGGTGGSAAQMIFALAALSSFLGVTLLGWRYLLVRPTCYLLMIWWGFLLYALGISLLSSVDLALFARVIFPMILVGAGITVAHLASCQGMRPGDLIKPILMAAAVNIVWRITHGFIYHGVTLETARIEVLSPALNWSFAFIGCALLFRRKLHRSTLILAAAAITATFLGVTRALAFPILASSLMCGVCLLLAIRWKILPSSWMVKKAMPLAASVAMFGVLILGASIVAPAVLDRWSERLFHNDGGVTSKDVSWLTREAEASAMMEILSRKPLSFVHGKGVGASYYWDSKYYPELWLVYPAEYNFDGDFWFAGHSVWTYALFSSGAIGVAFYLAFFLMLMALSLRAVYLNRKWPDFDIYLGFLPFVAAWCFLSESATSNPFDERLMGILIGMMGGMSQGLFNRARQLHQSQAAGQQYLVMAVPILQQDDQPVKNSEPAFSFQTATDTPSPWPVVASSATMPANPGRADSRPELS